MNYALGCAFTLRDMFMNLPKDKLKLKAAQCGTVQHKDRFAAIIFKTCYKLVIKDIVQNNITFWFPLTGSKKCNMHMKRVQGIAFQKLRKAGKWKDVDILNSDFSGYEIRLFMLGNRTPREKTVYVDKNFRNQITIHTNQGKNYGDSKYDKYLVDYLPEIYKLYPDIEKSDIKRILNFGWKSLYLHNSYGGDTVVTDQTFWSYIGRLRRDSLDHFHYYIRKLTVKLRVLYRRKQVPWDGYYYFALTDAQYEHYLSQMNSRGRARKRFHFGTVVLYQLREECSIVNGGKKYIFRVPMIIRLRMTEFRQDYTTTGAELIEVREPLKFKDILVYEHKYEYL